jgi:hypothetical protein
VGLRDFVINAINERTSFQKIIVFSQDMVPDTICEESRALIREYLDAGGNVVWMGDIPFFYIGISGVTDPLRCIQSWSYGAPTYVGGIVPISSSTMRSVDLKWLGKTLGLSHHWTSARPILKDETIVPLAMSKNIGSDYHINVPKDPTKIDRILRKIKIKSVEIGGVGVDIVRSSHELEPLTRMYPLRPDIRWERRKNTLYETHVSAWIKNYNKEFPYCGFARIWDYHPSIFPEWMIAELYNFSLGLAKRVA